MFELSHLLQKNPEKVLAEYGKSFYFASLVFNSEQRHQVAKLYSFCRYVDDTADCLSPNDAAIAIDKLNQELFNYQGQTPFHQLIRDLEGQGVQREHMGELLQGALFDVQKNVVQNDNDLMLYCYRVAGVVGLMMCPLLGVKGSEAHPYAIDLGLAMQLTNICRDIHEDALNDRTYIPQKKLEEANIQIKQLQLRGSSSEQLKAVVEHYLDIADELYENSYQGLAYIPLRPRLCILIAGEVYRAIGHKIRRNDFQVLEGRVFLNVWEKLGVVLKTIPRVFSPHFWSTNLKRRQYELP